ncbi:hypothetical protein ACIGO9_29885 [Nocardia asteroides]|uniref:hypothetical protein n=1 Tax=Nocardia asteroides TaxID=1824 RepID=UPI0037C98747
MVLTSWLALAASAIWRSARRPGAAELRTAHAELRQHCRHLAPAEGAYLAIDHATDRRVHLTRRKRMGIATAYNLAVVETDQDNHHFLTAHFFTLNPAVADVRHITEPAAIDNTSDITVLDAPTTTPVWRTFRDAARAQRELLFATLTEVRALTRLLDEAAPPTHLE